jgi:arylsulfatase A-like enzyme
MRVLPGLLPLAVLACATPPAQRPLPERLRRPNIVFVYSDDHAAQAVSAYGSVLNRTPNIDRLAREGLLFRNAFCTNAICAPCRAVVLTGRHSHENGVIDNEGSFDGSQPTFPQALQAAGYQTALIGKWHLVSRPTGFDHWRVLRGQGPYYNPELLGPDGTQRVAGYTTEVLTDLALDWLARERDAQRPFLLMLQHKAPHRNWQPGPRQLGLFPDDLPEPPTLFDDYAGRASAAAETEMTIRHHMQLGYDNKLTAPADLAPDQRAAWDAFYEPRNARFRAAELDGDALVRWQYQRYVKDYLKCVAAVDDELGRVLDWLDASGLADDTVVVYTSDQGFFLGEHGWYDKRWMYEESLRTPLVVRWPAGIVPGTESDALVQNLDFAATFLELAGAQDAMPTQGASLVPLLRGRTPDTWRESIYYHYYEFPGTHSVARHCGVRTRTHKLIRYYEKDEWELFDLARDPLELRSVHADPAYAEVRATLTRELARLQALYGDEQPARPRSELRAESARRAAGRVPLTEVLRRSSAAGAPPDAPDSGGKPFTVGARVLAAGDGVLLAHGGGSHGWSLSIEGGRPTLAVRASGELLRLQAAPLAGPAPHHVAGAVDADGAARLYVDGAPVASGTLSVLHAQPAEGLTLGRDAGSAVGGYEAPFAFAGELTDLRLYWGVLDDTRLAQWARGAR